MVRGRGFSPRGGYRGGRGGWGGGYSETRYAGPDPRDRYDPRTKYSTDNFSSRSYADDYKSYRMESYMGRERRSPDRKRMRMEGPSSRHDSSYNSSYGSSRHEPPSSYSERRGYSGERHSSAPYRKEDYRSSGPSPRGSYRGRLSSRGSRGLRARDRPMRRRLIDSSYVIRRRTFPRTDFTRRLRMAKLRRVVRKKSDGEEEDMEVKKEGDESEVEGEEDIAAEGEEAKTSSPDKKNTLRDSIEETINKRGYVKLQCPHCNIKCLTFRKYEFHLSSRLHLSTMRRLALKHKSILIQMRRAQRKSQNEMEKETGDELTTNFCLICRLNFSQKKSVHQLSESHKNMKKFLSPACKVCEVTFRSPIAYEGHIASISHLKRKHMAETGSDAEFDDNDLENFTTIDSVGDGTEPAEGEAGPSEEKEKKEKKEILNVGIDQIRKIETHYCDLCKMYLPRADPEEMPKIITKHCKQTVHMRRYVRMKERELMAKRAAAKKASAAKKEGDNNPDQNGDVAMKEEGKDGEEGAEDKLWADVDKDLGDILAEAESGNKSSDEDEDSHVNGERFDRFKLSEKTDEDKILDDNDESISENTKEAGATTEA